VSSKAESAELILRLYEVRREAVMRQARDWFFGFNPSSMQDIMDAAYGEHSAYYRMVTSYWDMAASFVNHGAIDEQMFTDANGEHVVVFAKIEPFLTEIREASQAPQYLRNLEALVMRTPDAAERLPVIRERMKQIAQRMAERHAAAAGEAS
jgi:hypothetical protein